jgi:multidrug efflux system membrane fusion protein
MPVTRSKLALALAGGAAAAALALAGTGPRPHTAAAAAAVEAPRVEVDVATVTPREITDWQFYSGRLEAVDRVELRPQVSGTITQVHFRNGSTVKAGDALFTIDPRPFEAEVLRAEAQLAAAQARVRFTAAELERARQLVGDSTISRRTFDEKENAAREAAANVQAAEAALQVARLNLGYTQVTAPVDGRVGRAEVTVGNLVAAGAAAAPLTTLVSVDPIYASFEVDEQTYLAHIAAVKDADGVPVDLGLANEAGYPRHGTIEHVDNRLDSVSGTIRVRARFANPDGVLVPGLFARVKVGASTPHPALTVDEKAIGTDQDKKFVLVVGTDDRVAYRAVTLGAAQDGQRIITEGLKPGERVVVNGVQRVRPGDAIQPRQVAMTGGALPVQSAER